ncbi:MAG TPA: ABC-2 transporter permease [Steroidobacteraceae bacterium]|nr:ABC-2 transporter permease [Steroidobacteraceae bacterium]
MNDMIWLIRREIWENRSLWIAPLVIAGVILISAAFGGIHVGDKGAFWIGSDSSIDLSTEDREQIRNAMATAALDKKQIVYAITLSTFTAVQLFSMSIVLFFYLLDSLLAERKDRSILFWKSLPVSDTQVVLSKLLTAAVVTPLFVLLVSSVLQVLFAGVWSIRFNGTFLGDALMAWDGEIWLKLQAAFLLLLVSGIFWYLPLLAYLMVVSVWARRNAFLWAVLPPVAILAIEGMLHQSAHFAEFLGRRFVGNFQIMEEAAGRMTGDGTDGMVTVREVFEAVTAVFTHYETWLGVLVAGAMIFGAIRIRRYRDDS